MTVHYLFPREAAHTNRVNQALAAMQKVEVANFATPRTEVPPAAMLEWAEEHDTPNVNTPRDLTNEECEDMIKRICLALAVAIPVCMAMATALGVRV